MASPDRFGGVKVLPKPLDRRLRNREYDERRRQEKPWRKLYATARWAALRAGQLLSQPLCERCGERNMVVAATVVHHREPHKGDPALFFDAGNLASSCKRCHDIDEQRIERGGKARQIIGDDGWPQ